MIRAYYNEFDPHCVEWLRNLIAAGHLPPGDVDERSITEVSPDEIRDYDQWHFFAGIGGWALAARLAGIGESSGVLTGSPPCQPFSSAGKRKGYADERHLAPVWLELVAALRPAWVFGEQVAAAIKKDDWLDDLLDALEREGYATGAVVLPACGVGAPHIRQRLWVVARLGDGEQPGLEGHCRDGDGGQGWPQPTGSTAEAGESGGLADAGSKYLRRGFGKGIGQAGAAESQTRQRQRGGPDDGSCGGPVCESRGASPGETGWNDPDWLYCRDGKWRPVESGTFPLAHGVPARVGRLRAYGNAIVPEVAAEVMREAVHDR